MIVRSPESAWAICVFGSGTTVKTTLSRYGLGPKKLSLRTSDTLCPEVYFSTLYGPVLTGTPLLNEVVLSGSAESTCFGRIPALYARNDASAANLRERSKRTVFGSTTVTLFTAA